MRPCASISSSEPNAEKEFGSLPFAPVAGNWRKQEPIPTPWYFYDVDMVSSSEGSLTGIAIVDASTLVAVSGIDDLIFRSTNAGASWTAVPHPQGGTWFGGVRFVPGTQTGWTVGEGGKILKTTDRGATWALQRNASHSFSLFDVSFADLNNGWAAGNGEQLHTTDGGTNWVNQNTGISVSFSVYAVSPTVAWIGGVQDLAQTIDGGATWTIEAPSNTAWYCLNFLDTNNGWAGGQDQTIDDVPGSIWKRSGSAAAPFGRVTPLEGPDRRADSGAWQTPPDRKSRWLLAPTAITPLKVDDKLAGNETDEA